MLRISRTIDALNERIGRLSLWLVLMMVIVGVWNVLGRYIDYAIALVAVNRKVSVTALQNVCDLTLRTTGRVMFILIGSTAFSLVFRGLNGDRFMFDLTTARNTL